MIQHVSLESRRSDEAALVRFWELLGFEAVEPPPSLGERATWLQSGATQVHLLWADDPVVPPQGHVAVQVGDLAATVEGLRAAGFGAEERARHWGAERYYTRSPGGHLVELFATAP